MENTQEKRGARSLQASEREWYSWAAAAGMEHKTRAGWIRDTLNEAAKKVLEQNEKES
jgi:hypothetical protein